ncbi:hypothetical protein DAPPUDRAFT_259795 [Daphnia pulex]|uniref:Retrotransposon Copia-like N-terminal domain-containing protein n=1 Tax=Daphnia pulex TaxID=6669 RepID=E9HHW0_DAPPU|nr:hypothetical protein DAPPUDRAFT_259795 [Daphnia pulex]|eukprot:EFX68670.1 hypothetical protein DAPPUDRAFT_259795 [Daphnia pulex]
MNSAHKDVSHIAKYDGANFSLWKLGLFVLLEQNDLIDVTTGVFTLPEQAGEEIDEDIEDGIEDWRRKDVRARGFILSTTELSQQRLLISCTTAHQMWRTLSAQHLEHAADNRLDVQARFYSY